MKRILLKPLTDNDNIYLICSKIIENISDISIQKRLFLELEKQFDSYYNNAPIVLTFSDKKILSESEISSVMVDLETMHVYNSEIYYLQSYIDVIYDGLR